MVRAYRQNKLPKVKLAGPDHEEFPDEVQPDDKPLTAAKEKSLAPSAKDSSSPTQAQKEGEESKKTKEKERGQTRLGGEQRQAPNEPSEREQKRTRARQTLLLKMTKTFN